MKRLAARFIACAWLCVTLSARAEDVPTPGFLPSTAQASAWIEADPAVARARLAAEAANHGGAAIAAGPHEWTARVQGQRRSYQDSGARSNEWTAALERAIRVNGKAGLDRQLRDLEVELGRARLGEARHEAARTLADAWTGVIVAKRQHALLRDQLAIAMSNLDVVTKRQRAGDASALDSNVAQGDIGSIARDVSQAATEVVKAEATLRVRFAAVVPDGIVLPPPQTPVWPEAQWRERVLEEADPIKTAETEWRRAGVTAARARADRIADPTVGVFAANEAMRNERVVGLSISIPFGGSYRSARALQAGKETDALQAALDQTRREIELEAAQTYAAPRP